MAYSAYRIETQPNRAKLEEAVAASLTTETPLGAPFETTTGEWAQAMVTGTAP